MFLRRTAVEVRAVEEFAGLIDERLGECRMDMSKRTDSDPSPEIEVFLSLVVPDTRASTTDDGEVETGVISEEKGGSGGSLGHGR